MSLKKDARLIRVKLMRSGYRLSLCQRLEGCITCINEQFVWFSVFLNDPFLRIIYKTP